MNYELHLRTGYRFLSVGNRQDDGKIIAYFLAKPKYPLWVRIFNCAPKEEEAIVLHESLAAFKASKEELIKLTRDWEQP
ncbi:MAG: hypothetical protein PHV34_07765 [Verrucomicrobiae bacterium]|nr:hypothetical protein [Verrucomicrobiae bacterium]